MPVFIKLALLLLLLNPLTGCGSGDMRSPEEHLAAAQDYLDRKEPRAALIELKNVLLQAPDNALARQLLGETHLALGDGPSAEKELSHAASMGVDAGYIQPLLARALLLQRDYDGVLEISADQVGLMPQGRASIHATRGMALLGMNQPDQAGVEFDLGLAQDDQSLEVLTGMAWLAAGRQEPDKARDYIDRVFSIDPDYAEAWSLLGNLERTQGKLEAAREAYDKAIDNRHANIPDRLNRIAINIAMGNQDEAKAEIGAIRKQGTQTHLLDYLDGLLAYQQQRYPDAISAFEKALQANPQHIRSLYYAGTASLLAENLSTADSYLRRFNAKNPGFAPALKMLAWIAIQNGNYRDAEQYIRPVLAQEPEDTFSLNLLASALQGNNKSAESVEVLQQVLALQPDSASTRHMLGVSMIMEGKLESGLAELEAARELDPDIQQTSLAIIFTHLKNKELDKALEAAKNLHATHPDSVVANAALGTVYLSRQERDKASQAFRDTLALDADNVTANSGLASLAVQEGRIEEAKTYYRTILEKDPGRLNTSMNLAYLSALDGSVDEMKSVLEQAIEANPGSLLPRLALARYYFKNGEHDKVVTTLTPVYATARGNPVYLQMLSESLYHTGDYVRARDNLEALADMAPGNASVHYLLAMTQRRLDDTDGARASLERVLELEPTHVGARSQSIELMIAAGNTQEARDSLADLKEQSGESESILALEGRLASASGDHQAAVAAYQRAFEQKQTNINLLKLEAATWDSGEREAAIELLTAWLEKLPNDQTTSMRLASRYVALDRESEAIAVYTGMLEQSPDYVPILNDLAWLLQDSDPKQAQKYAEKAHSLAPRSHAVTDTLAVVVSKSDPARAQLLIREALAGDPRNPAYRYHQALILKRAGEDAQALRVVKEVLQDSPDFPAADEARQLLKELEG